MQVNNIILNEKEITFEIDGKCVTYSKKEDIEIIINLTMLIVDSNFRYDTGSYRTSFLTDKLLNSLLIQKNICKYIRTLSEKSDFYLNYYDSNDTKLKNIGYQDYLTYFMGAYTYLGVFYNIVKKLFIEYRIPFDKEKYVMRIEQFKDFRNKVLVHAEEHNVLENKYNENYSDFTNLTFESALSDRVEFNYFRDGKELKVDLKQYYLENLSFFLEVTLEVFIKNKLNKLNNLPYDDNEEFEFYFQF